MSIPADEGLANELFDAPSTHADQPIVRDEDGDDDDPNGPPIYFVSLTEFEIARLLAAFDREDRGRE